MCGIVGIYLKTKKYEKHLGKFLSGMLDGMARVPLTGTDWIPGKK